MSLTTTAILLGIVEGLTEFLPVSSTGHLVLATKFFGYDERPWEVFNIVIQLPAILAVVVVYWRTIWAVIQGLLRGEAGAIRFVRNILVAFIPSAILGVLLKKKIDMLLETPVVIAWALLIGGIAIIVIEKLVKQGRPMGLADLPVGKSLAVGFMQCLAMVPGVSRSGATIMGALSMGVERRTAAEFSFFLAIPTMFGATAKQLFDHRHELSSGVAEVGFTQLAIGSVVSFVVALAVLKPFVGYVSRSGFMPFAIYRIILGAAAIVWLSHS
ncbi:undecaprenyl-diphosphate phosphatase [Novosphingobium rosa]|uniref:undecaprenyl-diphosphate phosphatase n=1 Tax=Novosphingobium rosa TaxID=76978 RepID=UPI000836AB0F|nr:undecaprenyl-diphosphate phosphatase [Novosphingobium rosa]